MLYAVRGNKEVAIEEKEEQTFLSNGYDIFEKSKDDKITLKKVASSKKVSYEEYQKVIEENKKLKAENKKLKDVGK